MKIYLWKGLYLEIKSDMLRQALTQAETKEQAIEQVVAYFKDRHHLGFCSVEELKQQLETKKPQIIEGGYTDVGVRWAGM
jgi:hypothetical protein